MEKKKKKKKSDISTLLLIFIFIVGLSLLLYPTISDYYNSFTQSKAIVEYAEAVDQMDPEEYERILNQAHKYNEKLLKKENRFSMTEQEEAEYNAVLNPTGNGIMGYIEIPSISCSLPIYHTVDHSVLQVAVGHIEWSSLPVGGQSNHTVLSGHRGLPSAKLFSELDRLAVGDIFVIRVLNEVITYQVDKIQIVLPKEIDTIAFEKGETYCTLVTCTPYGVNSHRILVRGTRIESDELDAITHVMSDAIQIEPYIIAPIVAIPILAVLFTITAISDRKKRKHRKIVEQNAVK